MTTLSSLRLQNDTAIGGTGLDSAEVLAVAGKVSSYSTVDSLPTTGLAKGNQAYITSNNRYYISNGSGWYNVALEALAPTIDSIGGYRSTLDSTDSLTLTIIASDSDTPIVSYGATLNPSNATDSAVTTFSRDSSVITLATSGGSLSDFDITFTASDNITVTSLNKTFNISRFVPVAATGGTTNTYTLDGVDYKSHAFLSTGSTNFVVSTAGTVDVFLVGGGGGGGGGYNNDAAGGGGGAGAFRIITDVDVIAQTYAMIVGAGGLGGCQGAAVGGANGRTTPSSDDGAFGGDTSAFGYTANGGGSGTSYRDMPGFANGNASCGGAGGAGGQLNNSATTRNAAGAYGNQGGYHRGTGQSNGTTSCGGGGGAGGAGATGAAGQTGGAGGIGSQNNYRTGSNVYYAGGGGGGATFGSQAAGGTGGGGASGTPTGNSGGNNGVNGTANTGGGGGGASAGSTRVTGGTGGSGIIVVRYAV